VRPTKEHAISLDYRVEFHHCDPLGVVWHGRYFEFLEGARAALMKSVGLDVPEIRALGHRMFVTEARCRYMAAASLGDELRVTAWFSGREPLIRVTYDVYDVTTERWCARATTVLATTDAAGGLIARTPDAILSRLPRD